MAKYIDADILIANVTDLCANANFLQQKAMVESNREDFVSSNGEIFAYAQVLSLIKSLQQEQSEDISLIKHWFEHIAQIADDRKTLTGEVMKDSHALDEIKSIAKNSVYYIEHHANTLGLENARKEE